MPRQSKAVQRRPFGAEFGIDPAEQTTIAPRSVELKPRKVRELKGLETNIWQAKYSHAQNQKLANNDERAKNQKQTETSKQQIQPFKGAKQTTPQTGLPKTRRKQSGMPGLEDLPPEVLAGVFQNLDYLTLKLSVRCVCRTFNDIIGQPPKSELARAVFHPKLLRSPKNIYDYDEALQLEMHPCFNLLTLNVNHIRSCELKISDFGYFQNNGRFKKYDTKTIGNESATSPATSLLELWIVDFGRHAPLALCNGSSVQGLTVNDVVGCLVKMLNRERDRCIEHGNPLPVLTDEQIDARKDNQLIGNEAETAYFWMKMLPMRPCEYFQGKHKHSKLKRGKSEVVAFETLGEKWKPDWQFWA